MDSVLAHLHLAPDDPRPIYLQLVDGFIAAIQDGRLRPGDSLPGTRRLAEGLGVGRNSVLTAYAELTAQGWIVGTVGSGSTVATGPSQVPVAAPVGSRNLPSCGFELPSQEALAREEPGAVLVDLRGAGTDPRLLPEQDMARTLRRVIQGAGRATSGSEGSPALREALARDLRERRGLPALPERLLLGRGRGELLHFLAQALLRPGDRVAVEDPGDPFAREAFHRAGGRLVPVPVDEAGLRMDALEAHLAEGRLRLVHVTPGAQHPTGARLSPSRRADLMRLASRHRFALLEEDGDAPWSHAETYHAPLAAEDPERLVLHLGEFGSLLAPAFSLAYLCAPRRLVRHLEARRRLMGLVPDVLAEGLCLEVLRDGSFHAHLRRARLVYRSRREAALEGLARVLGDQLQVDPPVQGLALWARVQVACSARDWARRAERLGLWVDAGHAFDARGHDVPALRLGFGTVSSEAFLRGLSLLRRAFGESLGRREG